MIYRIVIHLDRPVVDLPTFTVHHPYFLITLHDPPAIHFYSDITHVGSEQHVPAVRARMILLEACDAHSPLAFVGFGNGSPSEMPSIQPRRSRNTTLPSTLHHSPRNGADISIDNCFWLYPGDAGTPQNEQLYRLGPLTNDTMTLDQSSSIIDII